MNLENIEAVKTKIKQRDLLEDLIFELKSYGDKKVEVKTYHEGWWRGCCRRWFIRKTISMEGYLVKQFVNFLELHVAKIEEELKEL